MNQPSLVLPFTSLDGTSAYNINIQVGYWWSFVSVVNCVQFSQVWCIRSTLAWSQWDLWEAEVTAASRYPIGLLSELFISVIYICSVASFRISADSIFLEDLSSWSRQQFYRYIYSGFFLSGSLLGFGVLISSRRLLQPSFVEFRSSSWPPGHSPWQPSSLRVYCFVLFALLCCNVVFRVNLLRISLTYFQFVFT